MAVSERSLLVPMPSSWSFEQAASVPTVFGTAYHGLVDLAGLQAGQRVLIHAGAGGVGMAAIQIAHHIGAEVFATASPAKWEALHELGLAEDRIASSRDLDFKQKFLEVTDGEGVDVVLNSLAGEFVDASLDLLPRGGHFLEMGKTDIRDPERVAAAHEGVDYRAYNLPDVGPERLQEILVEVVDLFERGAFRHLPISSWDVRRAPEAFRFLREGRNVGKIVLGLPRLLDPGSTVLITGATGVLGSQVARHLATEHGARHLLLVSRSGKGAEGAAELQAELEGLGAETRIEACDVSDREQLAALLETISAEHPLGAVIHAAGALADGTIEAMGSEQVGSVFAPKVDAAWHLHELTVDLDLSAFVMFSSVAGAMGTPGQANYAAANVFLDSLAAHRRAEGLPATSIAWGYWEEESGMTSHLSEADLARMQRVGIAALSNEQGLALFDTALAAEPPLVLAAPFDRVGLQTMAAAGMLPPILSGLVRTAARRRTAASGSLAVKLAALPEAEREDYVLELVRSETAAVLGHGSSADVEPGRAFKDLGFDSLAAVELRNRLGATTGLRLPATLVFDYPSAAAIGSYLLGEASASSGTTKAVAVRTQASDEPIAIVGMACRYPGGVGSPRELWELVAGGADAVAGFPADRGWDLERLYHPDPDHSGTSYAREGGFLADAADFDASFFSISPREALAMDPQQRLLLEACWEALEDAGIDPVGLRGEPAGVFAGISSQDYGSGAQAPEGDLGGYMLTGGSTSVVSGRIAYALGLEGPAITIDTACSSSLVALHLASQALRNGECSLAMAGGVTVLSTPGAFVEFSQQRGLAPDGRSKSFAEAADGVGWSEGVGVLALERLSDAERNGHRVLATIRGSAINQDGASNGLTAPNGPSQERVIRQALANANLSASEIDAVEAHGTGTTLGDPIEAGALLATYGQERETPLKLGSIKSNIGHAQAAAGVAGVIKMALAMRAGVMPKTLHVDAPSSKVEWGAGEVELLTEAQQWETNGRPRRAGISSFGFSGTNAHAILEEGPALDEAPTDQAQPIPGPLLLPLSAKGEEALRDQASRLGTHLTDNPELDLQDVAYSLATTRSAFEHRAVAVGEEREELIASLTSLAQGEAATGITKATARSGKLAYLLTGQGSQRPGMGKGLYETYPVYAEALDEVCEALDQHLDKPLKDLLFCAEGSKEAELLDHTSYAQPALFATEVALYRLLESQGLTPDFLAGHSIGEIAAAHIAGVLSLPDAAKLVAARGKLMGELPESGAMLALQATEQEAQESIEGKGEELSIAAINSPTSTVISGTQEAIEGVEDHWESQGRKTKRLEVSHAFHSHLMEPMLGPFAEVAKSLSFSEPQIPIVSNLSGEPLSNEQATDPAYWVSQVRGAVRFADAVASLDQQGATTYLELGPDAVLTAMASECLEEAERPPALIPTLRRDRPEAQTFALSLAGAHAAGAKLDWGAFFDGTGVKRVPLPTYPFQRKRYWLSSGGASGDPSAIGLSDAEHPLLAARIEDPEGEGDGLLFTGRLSLATHPWLADHAVAGTVLLPGTALVELALKAGSEVGAELLEELTLQAPLILPEQGA